MNIFILLILSLGFFLLIERKLLSLINFRFGPNKNFLIGIFQFLIDGLKLLMKEFNMELMNLNLIILIMLMFMLLLNLMFWLFFNLILLLMYFILILILLMIMKLLVLFFIIIYLKNNFSYLGFMRMLIQLISYDIMIFFFFLILYYMNDFYDLIMLLKLKLNLSFFNYYYFFMLFFSIMIETSRLPFDFLEGESELVSGFNIEFGSMKFMMIFLVEYLDMMFFSLFCSLYYFYFIYLYLIFVYLFIYFRGMFLRYRYDKMMILMWMYYFPLFICLTMFLIIELEM